MRCVVSHLLHFSMLSCVTCLLLTSSVTFQATHTLLPLIYFMVPSPLFYSLLFFLLCSALLFNPLFRKKSHPTKRNTHCSPLTLLNSDGERLFDFSRSRQFPQRQTLRQQVTCHLDLQYVIISYVNVQ